MSPSFCPADSGDQPRATCKTSIYFDGLGMTLMPGISYERKLNSTTAVRIGIGHFDPALFNINLLGHHDDEPTPQVDKSITTLPVSVQYWQPSQKIGVIVLN